MADRSAYPGAPRWVKASGIVVAILALLLILMMVTGVGGPHGPGRHTQSGDAGGDTSPPGMTEDSTSPADPRGR